MFLVILSVVSAAIVAFIIYTLTMGKIREIAVLKLIGTMEQDHCLDDPATGAGIGLTGRGRQISATPEIPIFREYWPARPEDGGARADRRHGHLFIGQRHGDQGGPQGLIRPATRVMSAWNTIVDVRKRYGRKVTLR